MGEAQRPLLRQLLALTLQQQSLLFEEGFRCAGHPGMMLRLLSRHSRSERLGARPGLGANLLLAAFLFATQKSAENTAFRHIVPASSRENFACKAQTRNWRFPQRPSA